MVKDIRFHKGMTTNKEDVTSEAALTARYVVVIKLRLTRVVLH
jgi:hypothetical protein